MAYEKITRYREELKKDPGRLSDAVKENGVWRAPIYDQSKVMEEFQSVFYEGGFADQDYFATFEKAGVSMDAITPADIAKLDAKALLAVLTFCIRSERFGEGSLYHHAVSGILDDCPSALAAIDEKNDSSDEEAPCRT